MFTRSHVSLMLAILLSLILAVPAFAGGWAVITLDDLPSDVVAGRPITIGFTVLQHGRTPMTGLSPTISANLYKEQEFVVAAEPEGKPGHYTATVTFPKEGEWRWSVQAFTMDQTMPMLTVAAPNPAAADSPVMLTDLLDPLHPCSWVASLFWPWALPVRLSGSVAGADRSWR